MGGGTSSTMRLEQRRQILAFVFQLIHRPAVAARGEEVVEVELLVVGVQRQEQIENAIPAFRCGWASERSILLTTTIGFNPSFSALESTNLVCGMTPSAASTSSTTPSTIDRMRSTSPPKSAWPGVSTILMRVPLPFHRGAFGQNGDAALAFLIVGIHGALGHVLVVAHRARLLEELVDQRGLAMIDMGDNGDIADIHESARLCARGGGLIDEGLP